MNRVQVSSYILFLLCLIAVRELGMATPILTVLFTVFCLNHFTFFNQKWISISLTLILVLGIFSGFVMFIDSALHDLPEIMEGLIPSLTQFAERYNITLPFSDIESLKVVLVGSLQEQLGYLANFAKIATKEFVFLIIGIVVSISIFLNSKFDLGSADYNIKENLYTVLGGELMKRFATLYKSFSIVIGAQLLISTINTIATSVLVLALGLPYFGLTIAITFLCGLLPIIGNVISNTIIFAIAVKVSLFDAVVALLFLIAIHKGEYFLNSKIIGGRIKNPMWLTLIGLIAGERLMGIPGMILAPVLLQYLKIEGSQIEIENSAKVVVSA